MTWKAPAVAATAEVGEVLPAAAVPSALLALSACIQKAGLAHGAGACACAHTCCWTASELLSAGVWEPPPEKSKQPLQSSSQQQQAHMLSMHLCEPQSSTQAASLPC